MSTKVLLKKSSVAGKIPTPADLSYGEVALNYADGKLYYKDSSNSIKDFSAVPQLSINNLTDVDTTSTTPTVGQVLKWNGTNWVPGDDATVGGTGTDADTLDGFDSSYFLNYNNLSNTPTLFSGSYTDLTNKPNIATDVSQLTDNAGVLFSGSYTDLTNKPTLFSGAYEDLTGKPTIPVKTGDLINDAGFITGYTETDPIYTASTWYTTENNSANWGTAYSWGDHSQAGYLLSTGTVDWVQIVNVPRLFSGSYTDLTNAPTLFSGSYNDLSDKPTLIQGSDSSTDNAIVRFDATTGKVLQNSLVTISDSGAIVAPAVGNIIPFYWNNQASFPNATTYHGAIAHSHADGRMYFAHAASWVSLANTSDILTNTNQLTNGAGFITSSALSGYATETYVNTQVANLVDSSPTTLNTLNELAAALGDDPNFATTITNIVAEKAKSEDLASVAFSGLYNDLINTPTFKTINGQSLLGSGDITITGGAGFSGDYNDLTNKPVIPTVPTNVSAFTNDANYASQAFVTDAVSSKQNTLVSGTNIKTINGQPLLGSGNIVISGGSGSNIIIEGTETLTNSNPAQIVDTYNKTVYRTAKYLLQAINNDEVHATEITLTHNDTNVFINEYGTIYTGVAPLITITAEIDATNVYLKVTPVSDDTVVDFTRISIIARVLGQVTFDLEGDLMLQSGSEDLMDGSGTIDLMGQTTEIQGDLIAQSGSEDLMDGSGSTDLLN